MSVVDPDFARRLAEAGDQPPPLFEVRADGRGLALKPPPWPRPGRCTGCDQPAEQFPSKRWRHIGQPCPARSRWLTPTSELLAVPVAAFVADEACAAHVVDLDALGGTA